MKRPTGKAKATASCLPKKPLRHRFFALRHGESEANVAKIIISDPKVGTKAFGLTAAGRKGATRAGQMFKKTAAKRVVMVSSDFSRAKQTAQLFAQALRKAGRICPLRIAKELRERRFGSLEADSDARYPEVWAQDRHDPAARPFGVEAAQAVQRRTSRLVAKLDRELPDGADVAHGLNWRCHVLVSHGDALQILQTAFLAESQAPDVDVSRFWM
ncbi:Phosphoglycerate mutase (PGAM) (BPG-dependent PGAM) (MPGM) (Phosphoglyceromutase) [Durusdinium trenchii]|uniref:Phosphoglycerate mutase (PGAM) (BPG-dependent PGAM) (MPGM) (Phosphoglyceromutase) n=1 Tax=Durusdinium trenchii TaxID=1381693 RepID=A0ABP0PG33_9DINO